MQKFFSMVSNLSVVLAFLCFFLYCVNYGGLLFNASENQLLAGTGWGLVGASFLAAFMEYLFRTSDE